MPKGIAGLVDSLFRVAACSPRRATGGNQQLAALITS